MTDKFIECVKPGVGECIIFIDGFLTESVDEPKDWMDALKYRYPDNPWYYVRWESRSLHDICIKLAKGSVVSTPLKMAGVPLAVGIAMVIIWNEWQQVLEDAQKAGIKLGNWIYGNTNEKQRCILLGHSLGARIIYYALSVLQESHERHVREAHLFGGAMDNAHQDWLKCAFSTTDGIINYYIQDDSILNVCYKTSALFTSTPIGCAPIAIPHPKIRNRDVSLLVHGHAEYKKALASLL